MADRIDPVISTQYSELAYRDNERAIAFMKAVWKLGACRTCEGPLYELMGLVVLRMVGNINTMADSKAHKRPTASLTCVTCGEVRFLDLTVAGIHPVPPANPEVPRESGPSGGPFR